MKNFNVLVILGSIFVLWLSSGCGKFGKSEVPDDGRFPASIGSFRREMIYNEKEKDYFNEKNKNQKYKLNEAKYSDGTDLVFYGISAHQKADDAINEQSKEAVSGSNTAWKTVDLKDKSGKNVGKLTICRTSDSSPESPHAATGGFNYSVGFNVDNQNHNIRLTNSSNNWTPQTNDKLVDFIKALPAAAQLDLSMLDLITTKSAGKGITVDKLTAVSPPVKLAAAPYLKGKVAVLSNGALTDGVVTDMYVKESERQANLMEEVGSIVKIECGKGASIGQYVVKETGAKIPAFSSVCKVSVIDNSIPAVIAQKSFTNSVLVDNYTVETDKKGGLKDYQKEYVSYAPTDQITEFLNKLPRK